MALKQSLQQKLGLKINPLQIQLIKLLELPTYQLEQRIKEELYGRGALYASMTGSGTGVFGIFPKGEVTLDTLQGTVIWRTDRHIE